MSLESSRHYISEHHVRLGYVCNYVEHVTVYGASRIDASLAPIKRIGRHRNTSFTSSRCAFAGIKSAVVACNILITNLQLVAIFETVDIGILFGFIRLWRRSRNTCRDWAASCGRTSERATSEGELDEKFDS